MFSSDKWLSNPASGFYPHSINQSLRFEDGDSPTLSRTPSSAGNRQIWTWSAWVKRGNITSEQTLFGAHKGANDYVAIQFDANDTLNVTYKNVSASGGSLSSQTRRKITTQVFRDVSSFYHLVVKFDAANTNCDIYVNGTEVTSFSVNEEPQDLNFEVNSTELHTVGTFQTSVTGVAVTYFDGYMSQVNLIDGTALTADSFGELKDGIWVAKNVSGLTFGTNGFHLDFADSSAIGNDVSGQNNDFAVSGLVASDVVPDSPTNGFPTANPLAKSSMVTLSEGNLKVAGNSASNSGNVTVSPVVTSGKWYFEYLVAKNDGDTNYPQIAAYRSGLDEHRPFINGGTGTGGQVASFFSLAFGLTNGDILGIAVDADGGTVKFYDNNSYISGKDIDISAYDSTGIWIGIGEYNTGFGYLNFGQDSSFAGNKTAQGNGEAHEDFFYTPPSGYSGLNLKNFDEPAIIDGSQYFNTVLWTGTGNDDLAVTGVGFSPSWSWMKRRSATGDQLFFDVVRGNGKQLKSAGSTNSPGTSAESTQSNKQKTFTADGFTLGTDATVNANNGTYVAWNWLAGTSVSGNTTGSGTAKAYSGSVNAESGFSIITYKGNGTAGHTIPHNLTVGGVATAPTMAIFKNRDVNDQWAVYHKDILATHNLCLNDATAKADQDNRFNDTEPTGSVMTLGTGHVVNATDEDYIAYFFTDIDQYCKAGVYIGNANPDGPYVHLGFRPAFLLIKRSDSSSHWVVIDTKRSPFNEITAWLGANLANSESSVGTNNEFDILSNGFKNRNDAGADIMNQSGASYIYLAISEQPAKYSNAR